jgi:hypothetical protein
VVSCPNHVDLEMPGPASVKLESQDAVWSHRSGGMAYVAPMIAVFSSDNGTVGRRTFPILATCLRIIFTGITERP